MNAKPDLTSRIGLVLGAGGASGAAFHAGTLLALHHDLGWSPNSADVIVGSSAGSIVAGLLRAGLTTDDLAAWGSSVEALPAGRMSRRILDDMRTTRHRIAPSVPRLRLPPRAMWRQLLSLKQLRVNTAALALLPHGWIDASANLERIDSLLDGWPDQPLWITAVRTADARRVVFGRDDIAVSPGKAIAASCAIPGLFKPVTIDRHRYIDGGAHSPTNAELLLDAGIDTALVLSPMSGQSNVLRKRPTHRLRAAHGRRLRAECASLTSAGIDVHIFEPDAATLKTMGVNALDNDRTPRVVRDSFLSAGRRIAEDSDLRARLATRAAAVGSGRDPRGASQASTESRKSTGA